MKIPNRTAEEIEALRTIKAIKAFKTTRELMAGAEDQLVLAKKNYEDWKKVTEALRQTIHQGNSEGHIDDKAVCEHCEIVRPGNGIGDTKAT